MAKLIELRDVYKIYSEGLESEVRALDGVSLSIEKGEFVAIVGQSGSGKSTMMNVLGCLDVPTYGEYLLEGTDVSELSDMQLSRIRNKEIGFIFQQYNLIQSLSVQENVELPLVYQGIGIDDRHELAIEAPFFGKNVQSMLKLGRAQGVAIAAAISRDVPVHEYAPMKIKMSITGNGQSSKEQVAGILKRMLHLREEDTVSFLDATDALAAAYCHALQDMRPQCMQGATVPVRSWSAFVRQNKERVSTPKSTVTTSAVCKKS